MVSRKRQREASPPPPYTRRAAPSKKRASNQEGVLRIIVGVDFGTTFTGVSWVSTEGANSKTLDDVHCIRDWPGPGRDGDFAWKAPSRIAYVADNPKSKITSNAWGFEVTPKLEGYTWMKLLLDPSESTKFDDPSLGKSEGNGVLLKPSHKSAVDLCADFLTGIATFAHSHLEKRLTKEILEATPIDFWFTVPAVWSDKAKYDTLSAAKMAFKQAKISLNPASRVFLVREPEAAAIATLSNITKGGSEQQIEAGDNILICDCGGGTVDITSYKINAVTPKLTFEELVVGTGGKCGSTYIDREFIKWMTTKFGPKYTGVSWEKRGPASRFMKDFEGFKRDFKAEDEGQCYEVTLFMKGQGDSHYYDEDESAVKIHHEDLKQMFDPVVSKIIALLQSQVDAVRKKNGSSVKTIILAGGFGDSNYLNKSLRTWSDGMGIRLLCPEHPQAAIVRGAALGGLQDIQPTSRRARLHYGVSCSVAFDPVKHNMRDLYTDEFTGSMCAAHQMEWSIAKGSVVDSSTRFEFVLHARFVEASSSNPRSKLYCSEADEAPRTSYHPACTELGEISLDFRGLNLSAYPVKTIRGRSVRDVPVTFVVDFGDRGGILQFSASVRGSEVGNTSFTFNGPGGQQLATHTAINGSLPPCAMQ